MTRQSRVEIVSMLMLVLIAVAACAPVPENGEARTPRVSYIAFEANDGESSWIVPGRLQLPLELTRKVPAVLIVHGSGGVDSRTAFHANSLNAVGIATLEIDMWGARGHYGNEFWRPQSVPETLPDAFGGLAFLAGLPFIDGGRIGIMGFSWGGVVSMLTATQPYVERFSAGQRRFVAHVPYYPVCWVYNKLPGYEFIELTGSPVLILTGELDDYDKPETCPELVASLPETARSAIEVTVYPDAVHGFNALGAHFKIADPYSHLGGGGEIRFYGNPEVAEKARLATDSFFMKAFGLQ